MKMSFGIKLQKYKMTEQEMKTLHKKIDAGAKAAIAQAIERHRKLGESISILQDGKIVTLTAEQIPAIQHHQGSNNDG